MTGYIERLKRLSMSDEKCVAEVLGRGDDAARNTGLGP